MCHSDGRRTVVSVHAGEILGPGLLLNLDILKSCSEAALREKRLKKIKSHFTSYPVTK